MAQETDRDIERLLAILDGFAESGEGRLKLLVSETAEDGTVSRVHHHGRCDIGSPWAGGNCFDAPEGACDDRAVEIPRPKG